MTAGAHIPASRLRGAAARTGSVLAVVLIWFVLVTPNQLEHLTPGALLRIPAEGLLIVAASLLVPARPRRILALVLGIALGLLAIVKVLDMGFFSALDRPFNPITDWGNLGPAFGVLRDSIGQGWAVAAAIGSVLLILAIVAAVTLAALRLSGLAARHRTASARTATALAVIWILCAGFGLNVTGGAPVASTSAVALAYDQVSEVRAGIAGRHGFESALKAPDPFAGVLATDLLARLRGKDVIVAFVESYGRVAVEGSSFSGQVDAVLNEGNGELRAAGISARSAFLTSPTFGGISWLAHSTLQSGIWTDNQARYNQLVASDRLTLSAAFKRAGWRTVGDVASNYEDWPEGESFYQYDHVYDVRNLGYNGPSFSYASMPDQYILSAFQRAELAEPGHPPVMAEIDLVSSHTPWTPLPRLVDWNAVGDGSVFDGMPAEGESPGALWRHRDQVRAAYGRSIQYSLRTLISFVQTFHDDNLVLVMLGDHQPARIVSGAFSGHDVPISIIARDPKVIDQISSWGWEDGLLPGPQAPVWRMDSFRDRFLSAFGDRPPDASSPSQR